MSLTLWNKRDPVTPLTPFNGGISRLREEMDRMFGRSFAEPWSMLEPKLLRTEGWFPAIDVSETDKDLTVRAEIPGIATKDLEISISGTTLTLSGQKEEKEEQKDGDFFHSERQFGSFRRVMELPDTIDPDKITAESDNGVLTIRVGKKPGVRTRKVEVKANGKKVAVAS